LIGLDLVGGHPEQVRLLVAHEAPIPALLPDVQRVEAERIQRVIESGARGPEWTEVMRKIAVDHSDLEPGVEIPAPTAQTMANAAFFREHDAPAAHRYRLMTDTLRAFASRIIAAGGEKSRDAFPYLSTRALADQLGIEFAEFPGDHAAFATRPKAFAAKLAGILGR
jgi:hypothetical protein